MAVIDHLVWFVPDLDAGIADAEVRFGVRPAIGGQHPGRGTHNALLALGDSYLELIAADPEQPEPRSPRPFGIDALTADRLITYAVRPADGETLDGLVASVRAAGIDPGPTTAMSRTTPGGERLHWHLTPPDERHGGAIPFLIDWGDTTKPHTTAPAGPPLAGLSVTTPDARAVRGVVDALGLSDRIDVAAGELALRPRFGETGTTPRRSERTGG